MCLSEPFVKSPIEIGSTSLNSWIICAMNTTMPKAKWTRTFELVTKCGTFYCMLFDGILNSFCWVCYSSTERVNQTLDDRMLFLFICAICTQHAHTFIHSHRYVCDIHSSTEFYFYGALSSQLDSPKKE